MSIDINYIINDDSTAPAGYSLSLNTSDCSYGVVVVQNGSSSSHTNVGVVTYDVGGHALSYEIKTLNSDNAKGNQNHFTGLDDAASYFEVYLNAAWDGTSMSGTQLAVQGGTDNQFSVALTYGQGSVDSTSTGSLGNLYTSTNYTVYLSNQTGATMNWQWSNDASMRGQISDGAPLQAVPLEAGNGQLQLTWPGGGSATFDVYDMTGNTCTVTGTGNQDAQPMVVSPDGGGAVALVNQTDGTLTAYFLGSTVHHQAAPGESTILVTDPTTALPWYVKWEVTGDPKIIVRRPATLTQ